MLAGCGSASGGGGTPQSTGTITPALQSSSPSGTIGTLRTATFSCAIKPGAGLLPSQTARPGRIVASIAEIESSTGLPISSSVDITMIGGFTQCRYQVGQGGQLDITLLNDSSQSAIELAKTKTQKLALHDRGCNGCTLSNLAAQPDLGPDGYKADNGNPLFGSITAGTYFEVEGIRLKDVRLQRLALVIAGNLSGGASPSLPPLPTPSPS
jgi:hypothetical protein